jgi:hypothetical protein
METLKILKNRRNINWDYNDETDIFYLTIGNPQNAIGMDIGEGLIVYYDESQKEIIGLNLTGLRKKVLKKLGEEIVSTEEDKKIANAEGKEVREGIETATYGKQDFDQGGEA